MLRNKTVRIPRSGRGAGGRQRSYPYLSSRRVAVKVIRVLCLLLKTSLSFPVMADEENFQWNVENTILFIDCYKQKPILWDPTDINYYKNDLKNDAWSEIAKCLNTNVESCKHKMTSLLSAFRREKNKTKKGKGTGKGNFFLYLLVIT